MASPPPTANPESPPPPPVAGRWSGNATLTLGLLLLPIALAAVRSGHGQTVLIIYAVASLITLVAYGEDKRRARKDLSRIPEALLHLLELFGGWPGAFVGRELFRHKTQKRSYRAVYWLIVTTHLYGAVDYLLDWRLRDAVLSSVASLFN